MRILTGLVVGVVAMALMVVFSGSAVASQSLYATSKIPPGFAAGSDRINMNENCGGVVVWPANAGFFVAHGWVTFPWTEEDQNAFMSRATTYELSIDGIVQSSVKHVYLVNFPDVQAMFKTFVIEDDAGLPAGSYTFVGQHYLSDAFFGGDRHDRVLQFECVVTVNVS